MEGFFDTKFDSRIIRILFFNFYICEGYKIFIHINQCPSFPWTGPPDNRLRSLCRCFYPRYTSQDILTSRSTYACCTWLYPLSMVFFGVGARGHNLPHVTNQALRPFSTICPYLVTPPGHNTIFSLPGVQLKRRRKKHNHPTIPVYGPFFL